MALVISASRLVRKMGQVRVLGLISAISSAVSVKWRSRSARSAVEWAKQKKSAAEPFGRGESVT